VCCTRTELASLEPKEMDNRFEVCLQVTPPANNKYHSAPPPPAGRGTRRRPDHTGALRTEYTPRTGPHTTDRIARRMYTYTLDTVGTWRVPPK
jgi:hypothetical protein